MSPLVTAENGSKLLNSSKGGTLHIMYSVPPLFVLKYAIIIRNNIHQKWNLNVREGLASTYCG